MTDLIDGVREPQLNDGELNKCDTLDTIIGLYNNNSPFQNMRLNPDGIERTATTGTTTTYYIAQGLTSEYRNYYYGLVSPGDYIDILLAPTFGSPPAAFGYLSSSLANAVTLITTYYTNQDLYFESTAPGHDFVSTVGSASSITPTIPWPTALFPVYTIPITWTDNGVASGSACEFITAFTTDLNPSEWTKYLTLPYGPSSCVAADSSITYNDVDASLYSPPVAPFQLTLSTSSGMWEHTVGEPYPTKYENPVSSIAFSFGVNRWGLLRPAKDGGFMIYETAEASSVPIGDVRVYRYNRTLRTKVASTNMNYYLP
jgi:hypothetical protein